MNQQFDKVADKLASILGTHENNNVAYAMQQLFPKGYAEGGEVEAVDSSVGDNIFQAIRAGLSGLGKGPAGGQQARDNISVLGGNYYNSAPHIASQYTSLGRFFTNTEPGNLYTNRYTQPQKQQALQSVDPMEFNAKWYNRLRSFSQAEELANKGQPQIRTR